MSNKVEGWGAAPWKVWTDKSSNRHARGIRVILQSLEGDIIECVVRLQFLTTNNEAKYEAVLMGLDLDKAARASSVIIHSDS